ncbi:MAG TPA: response regulator transcription factor [Euzebyales bacterium]
MAAAEAEAFEDRSASDVHLRHALVWDDDPATVARISDTLRRRGHHVHPVDDGDEITACLADHDPDMLVIGVDEPQRLAHVRDLRRRFSGLVVCYSDTAGARDRIALLASGVDDVVPSPLSFEELVLRVQAVARRADGADVGDDARVLTCGAVTADRGTHQIHLRDESVQLTAIEFGLLAFLMRNPRVAFTRRELLRRVWGYEIGDTSTVSVHVRRLRQKLEQDATHPEMIRTLWGSGYYFDPSAD